VDQDKLFYEDIFDALRTVVRALGGTKTVGAMLRPEKPVIEAQAWLSNCLDKNRPEKLDPEQFLMILRKGRETECHAAMHFLCSEAGYAKPEALEPEDELAKMLREYLDIQRRAGQLQPAIEQARLKVAK